LRIPLVVKDNLAASINAVGATFFGKTYEQSAKTLNNVTDRHPDGLLYFVNGSMLAVKRNWADAERAFRLAVEQPSLFGAVKPQALQGLIMTQCAIHIKEPITDQEVLDLRVLIGQRLAIQEPTPTELGQLSKAAVMAKDLNLARSIIQKALESDPESLPLNVFLAEIEFGIGNMKAAKLAAEKALELASKPQLRLRLSGQLAKFVSIAERIRNDSDF